MSQRAAITARPLAVTISNVVNGLPGPLSGKLPTAPVDPPSPLSLLALVRRENDGGGITSGARIAPTALLGPTSSLAYDPDVTVVDGVVTGLNTPPVSTLPLSYTVVSVPSGGGKIMLNPTTGEFSFLPYGVTPYTRSQEDVGVLVAEVTPLDTKLEGLPVVGAFVPRVLVILHQAPIVSEVLAPVIGDAEVTTITIDNAAALQTAGLNDQTPLAFTTMMTSFDGTKISVNYFPALGLAPHAQAPTILNGPGLASAGNTDPNAPYTVSGLVPGLPTLRQGYNVVTWDPRGEFASGGTLQLDSPAYEGKDVSSIITWTTGLDTTKLDTVQPTTGGPDPQIGMVGGSYGGGIQLVSAGIDSRIDAIVPGIAWNTLTGSLYPNNTFKTTYGSLLLLGLVTTGAKINNQIYAGIATGDLLGILTQSQQALLNSSGPDFLLPTTTTPTLFIQGTVDGLFPLQQSLLNAAQINAAAPVKMIWYCGGHGVCLDPDDLNAQSVFLAGQTMDWLDYYVADEHPITDPVPGPKFQWIDNNGAWHSSTMLPDDPGFATYGLPSVGAGGFLPIVPVVGGSGPQTANGLVTFPYSLSLAAPAKNSVNTDITTVAAGDQIVGSPTVSFDYAGIGTTNHVYVQIVDKSTGLVVGNIATPVEVTLDGKTHTANVDMDDIAYTVNDPDDLELQIVSSATPFLSFTSFGGMQISNVKVAMPIVN